MNDAYGSGGRCHEIRRYQDAIFRIFHDGRRTATPPIRPPLSGGHGLLGKFPEEAIKSGVIVSTGRLSQTTTRVRKDGDQVSVTDGPFIEGKELIPGFTVIRVDTKQEAIEWVTRYRDMMGMPELRIAEIFG